MIKTVKIPPEHIEHPYSFEIDEDFLLNRFAHEYQLEIVGRPDIDIFFDFGYDSFYLCPNSSVFSEECNLETWPEGFQTAYLLGLAGF